MVLILHNLAVLRDSTYEDDKTPIVIVIPGLTSDSSSAVSSIYCHLNFGHCQVWMLTEGALILMGIYYRSTICLVALSS